MVYQKDFFPSRFAICPKNFLGYAENNGAHSSDFEKNDKERVYLILLETGVLLDSLPYRYNVDLGRATCHSIKEGFANEAYLMTICQLVISGNKFCRDFLRFFEIKVIEVILVCIRLININLKILYTSEALKLLQESISLTPKVFSVLFRHKKIKNYFNANVLNMGPYSQLANQTFN